MNELGTNGLGGIEQKTWRPAEGTPTRVMLLRHGDVEHTARQNLYGQLDVPLSAEGIQQSAQCGIALKHERISAVYTSDLMRARILAEEIARHHGITPCVETVLRERNFGDWQGKSWATIEKLYPDIMNRYRVDRFRVRAPGEGSENFVDLRNRVIPFLHCIIEAHTSETIVVACHSGPARVIIAHALGLPLENMFSFSQDYCCLNVIDFFGSGRVTLQKLNATDHLGVVTAPDAHGL